MAVTKIGVLTFHRCINYGSYWQARCLVDGLQARGYEAVISDHHSSRVNVAEWKCAYQPVLPTSVPKSDYPLYRKKIKQFFQAFDTLPLSSRFPIDDPSLMDEFDVVVVGSDEVWNLFHPWYGQCTLFYGDGVKTQRLISYAASFGNYYASWGLNETWAGKLQNFSAISVRDDNSRIIINNALQIEPELVLDPCLQFPILAGEEKSNFPIHYPYIAVYGHNFSPSFIREVQRFARKKEVPLVSIGYRNDWVDEQWITAGPHDFALFMNRSQAIATNFFHGCVFALSNKRPFVCESTPYRDNKLMGLMKKIGGEKHLLSEEAPAAVYDTLLYEAIDPFILQNIEALRQASGSFLDRALGADQLKCA